VSEEVELIFSDGSTCQVWDRYSIAVDMLSSGLPFTFSMWRSERVGNDNEVYAWPELLDKARLYSTVQVAIGGYVQLCGVIEERHVSHSRQGAVLVISGRDTSALALECDANPRTVQNNAGLTDALSSLFTPIGVPFRVLNEKEAREARQGRRRHGSVTTTTRSHRVKHHRPRLGEKIWQAAESIVRRYGYMMWTAATNEGVAVVVGTPDYESASVFSFKMELSNGRRTNDSNVLSGELGELVRGVPTVVSAMSRARRGNNSASRFLATQTNSELPRYDSVVSPLPTVAKYIQPRGSWTSAHAQQEAVREQNKAMRDWRHYTCKVRGHSQEIKGQQVFYAPNTMSDVRDDVLGIDEPMLILRVDFEGSRGEGQTTKIKLGPRDAIQLTPEDESADQ